MENVREMAAALEALADWMEDKLASGSPAKWVAHQAPLAMREIVREAREASALRDVAALPVLPCGGHDPHVIT